MQLFFFIFWGIIHTLHEQYLQNLINNCRKYEPILKLAIEDQHCNRSMLKDIIYHIIKTEYNQEY